MSDKVTLLLGQASVGMFPLAAALFQLFGVNMYYRVIESVSVRFRSRNLMNNAGERLIQREKNRVGSEK